MAYQSTTDRLFFALSDPTRRALFARLGDRELPVHELASGFAVSRPAISQHLKVLADSKLVQARRVGRTRLYRARPDRLLVVHRWLQRYRSFWEANLEGLAEFVVAEQRAETVSLDSNGERNGRP